MKKMQTRIVEINVYRSKRNKKLGHAVAVLFPCNHRKYLGLTLYKGEPDSFKYRTQECKVLKVEDFTVTDKEYCRACPPDNEFTLDALYPETTTDDFIEVLDVMEDRL